MLSWLRRNAVLKQTGHDLYERIVTQARSHAFYRDCAVPDTMEGRSEMIFLHLFLVLERLKLEGSEGQKLGQHVMECLFTDMDDAFRQIGIGDMGVPRRIQKTAAALSERVLDYGGALQQEADSLRLAVGRHIFGGDFQQASAPAGRIANYILDARRALRSLPSENLLNGVAWFPDPEQLLSRSAGQAERSVR